MRNAILILVFVAALSVSGAAADQDAMYEIAKRAQIQLEIEIGPDDSDQINALLVQGTELVESIRTANMEEAAEYFLEAMQVFTDAFYILEVDKSQDDIDDASAKLVRQERDYKHLAYLAGTHGVSVETAHLNSLFEEARRQTGAGKGVENTIFTVIDMALDSLREEISLAAAVRDQEREAEYVSWYVDHLGRLLANFERFDIPLDDQTRLSDLQNELATATDSSTILSLIKEVISIKYDLNLANFDRMEVWIRQTGDHVDALRDAQLVDNIMHGVVNEMLSQCEDMIGSGALDDAEILLVRIDGWLIEREQAGS